MITYKLRNNATIQGDFSSNAEAQAAYDKLHARGPARRPGANRPKYDQEKRLQKLRQIKARQIADKL